MNAENSAANNGRSGLRVIEGGKIAGRAPPHSLEAEQYLLACCLLDGSATIGLCLKAKLGPRAFYNPAHRIVYEKILELYAARPPVELAMLAEELKTAGQLEAVGGYAYLTQISATIPTTAQAAYFIDKLKELWTLRELILRCTGVVEQCFNYQGGLRDLVEAHAAEMGRAVERVRGDRETEDERAAMALQRSLARADGKVDRSRWLYTGLKNFDQKCGPFDVLNEHWLCIFAGIQSSGKSALTRQIADHNLQQGKKGLVFLLETSMGKWLELAAATAAKVNARLLHDLPKDMRERFEQELRLRHSWRNERLWICDDVIPVETLVARVEEHARRHGTPDFVVVDHMHLLKCRQKIHVREQEVAHIANELKRCFKRVNTTGWVAAQLNRESRKEGNRRPKAHDIRDSSAVEQAADRIVMLYTPDTDMRGMEQTAEQSQVMVELVQDKDRNGPTAWPAVWFWRPQTRFFDIAADALVEAPTGKHVPSGGLSKKDFKQRQ